MVKDLTGSSFFSVGELLHVVQISLLELDDEVEQSFGDSKQPGSIAGR